MGISHRSQSGSALITALFIVAIVTILSAALIWRFHLWVNHAVWVTRNEKMILALEGVQDWGLVNLEKRPFEVQNIGPIYYKGMQLYGRLKDMQGRFNLNDLLDKRQQFRFVRFIQVVDPRLSRQKAVSISKAITNQLIVKNNASPFLTSREIRNLPEMTLSLYRRLKPYLSAIPIRKQLPINVNTASASVLMSVSMGLSVAQANALILCVKKQGVFSTLSDYTKRCLFPQGLDALPNTTVLSHYYEIDAKARLGSQTLSLKRLVYLQTINHKTKVSVLWQTMS